MSGRFNSKLVRLKAVRIRLNASMCCVFQFQTGAIKSSNGDVMHASFQMRFNSKLVRLKGDVLDEWNVIIPFQFQTGAIKSRLF